MAAADSAKELYMEGCRRLGPRKATATIFQGLTAGELARFAELEATILPLPLKLNLVDSSPAGELARFAEAKATATVLPHPKTNPESCQ